MFVSQLVLSVHPHPNEMIPSIVPRRRWHRVKPSLASNDIIYELALPTKLAYVNLQIENPQVKHTTTRR